MKNETGIRRQRIAVLSIVVVVVVVVVVVGAALYNYTQRQIYKESVAQLTQIGDHLIEKLEVQLDYQWSYLDKLEEVMQQEDALTQEELANLLLEQEKVLSPFGKTLYFRVIDEDGYYYTNAGKQGIWSGIEELNENETRQSFLLANWLDNENYLTFTYELDNLPTIDGHRATHIALLRSMEDMEEYFYISTFENQNLAYIVDASGTVLSKTGELKGIDFTGRNLYHRLSERTYPHVKNFESFIEAGENGDTICTDVYINDLHYYLIYNALLDYDWRLLLVVSADDVATSTSQMVESLLFLFAALFIILLGFTGGAVYFVVQNQKNVKIMLLREQNEKALEEKNRQLEELQQKTQEALEKAEHATKAKSQFLSNMSHDIRTPMNAIVGVSTLMEHATDDADKMRYYVKKLQSSSVYMLGIINDILDMSKIEAEEVELYIEPIRVTEQLEQIESTIRGQAEEKGQTFTVDVKNVTHEYLLGDSIRIRQVFFNLLTNAVKYTQNGGEIHFEVTELPCDTPSHAKFLTKVTDNGYGMSEEFLSHIFEPFTRETNSTTNKIQGTGLGMCITKNIVDLMDGTITVQSEKGKGSCFTVEWELPIDMQRQEQAEKVQEENAVEENTPTSSLQGKRFLCAEDNELNAEILEALLEMQGATCTIYANGKELVDAFASVKEGEYDAILMDVQMPVMNGLDAARAIRESENPLGREILIIAMTANAFESDVRDCLEAGMDAHISKPLDITILEHLMDS